MPKLDIDIAFEPIEGGRIGNKVHQTARGVSSEQRALWALQYFYSVDVKDGKGLCLRYRNVTLVKVNRVGRLDNVIEVVLGDASDRELRVLARQVPRDVNPGRKGGNIETFRHAEGVHLPPGKGIDRDRNFLQVLLAFLCDDDDLFQNALREDWAG